MSYKASKYSIHWRVQSTEYLFYYKYKIFENTQYLMSLLLFMTFNDHAAGVMWRCNDIRMRGKIVFKMLPHLINIAGLFQSTFTVSPIFFTRLVHPSYIRRSGKHYWEHHRLVDTLYQEFFFCSSKHYLSNDLIPLFWVWSWTCWAWQSRCWSGKG